MIIQITILLGLFIIWWLRGTTKPKNFPPGPPRYPFFGSYSYTVKPGEKRPNLFWCVRKFAKEYGSVFGFYLNNVPFVVLTDYDDIKEVLKKDEVASRSSAAPGNRVRPGWKEVEKFEPHLNEGRNPGVIGSNGKYWKEQRRFLLRNLRDFGFGKSSMEESLMEEVVKLNNYLSTKVGQPIDLNRTTNVSIVNALWGILVGERLELSDPKLLKLLAAFDNLIRGNAGSSTIANMLPYKPMVFWPGIKQLTGFDKNEKVFGDISDFVSPYIRDHFASVDCENIRDFLDLMIVEVQNTKDVESSFYGDTGKSAIHNNIIDLFIAGMETTSSALLWTILYMLHHPEMQGRVHGELDQIVGNDRLPSLDDRPRMHYTNAVLLESFRLTSFVPVSVPHYATADVKVGKDYVIPKGSVVLPSLFHVMYNPRHFKDPEVFNPSRFIDANTGQFVSDDHVIPFSIGKRYCLGQSLAEKEFFLFFSGLMQKFTFEAAPGKPLPSYHVDQVPVKGILRNTPPYEVIMKERHAGK